MRSTTNVAWVAGPLVLLGYLVGSLPVAYWLGRRRLRRDLGAPAEVVAGHRTAPDAPLGAPGELAAALVQTAATLAVTTLAWHVTVEVAPPAAPSSVAVLSAQAITVWQSVALWTGMAAVVGQVAPIWQRFRGGTGIFPSLGLLLAYAPLVFSAAVAGYLAALALLRMPERAAAGGFAAAVVFEWLAWVYDWRHGWGMIHGPELSLWVTVLCAVLFTAHRLRVHPGERSGPGLAE